MSNQLLAEIDAFLAETGLSDYRFGLLSAQNGRLMERLRSKRRVWPETEVKIRAFMMSARRDGVMKARKQDEARAS